MPKKVKPYVPSLEITAKLKAIAPENYGQLIGREIYWGCKKGGLFRLNPSIIKKYA